MTDQTTRPARAENRHNQSHEIKSKPIYVAHHLPSASCNDGKPSPDWWNLYVCCHVDSEWEAAPNDSPPYLRYANGWRHTIREDSSSNHDQRSSAPDDKKGDCCEQGLSKDRASYNVYQPTRAEPLINLCFQFLLLGSVCSACSVRASYICSFS